MYIYTTKYIMETMESKMTKKIRESKEVKSLMERLAIAETGNRINKERYEVIAKFSDDQSRLFKEKEQLYREKDQIRQDIIDICNKHIINLQNLVDELRSNIKLLVITHDIDDEVDLKKLLCI